MESEYIIDFERVNDLTVSIHDKQNDPNSYTGGTFAFSISRRVIKQYLELYATRSRKRDPDQKVKEAIETLVYNGILVSKSDIRDKKIKSVLDDKEG